MNPFKIIIVIISKVPDCWAWNRTGQRCSCGACNAYRIIFNTDCALPPIALPDLYGYLNSYRALPAEEI